MEDMKERMVSVILEDTIEKIRNDLYNGDESFLSNIILGNGFAQLYNLDDELLKKEYKEFMSRNDYIEPTLKALCKDYAKSDVCGGEYIDYVYENMSEFFAKPHNIPEIMKAIQEFRVWDADEEDEIVMANIEYVQRVNIKDIAWDSDDKNDIKELPTEVSMSIPLSLLDGVLEDEVEHEVSEYISNYLTETYSFTHKGFTDDFNKDNYFENEFQDYKYDDSSFVPKGIRIGVISQGKLLLDPGILYSDQPRNSFLEFDNEQV